MCPLTFHAFIIYKNFKISLTLLDQVIAYQMEGQTNRTKPICPLQFVKAGGTVSNLENPHDMYECVKAISDIFIFDLGLLPHPKKI